MHRRLLATALVLGALPAAQAGGIFYNSNQSAEYIRSFDRNSATDNADIVYYNMAGTPQLKEGWTLNFSDQMIFQKATVTTIDNPVVGDRTYKSGNPALLVPNFYAAYREKDWAIFCGLETIGATAVRNWNGGLPTLDLLAKQQAGYGQTQTSGVIGADAYSAAIAQGDTPAQAQAAATAAGLSTQYFPSASSLKGSSSYFALRLGGAIQLAPDLALAGALRYVSARQDIAGSADGYCSYDLYNHNLTDHTRTVIDVVDKAKGFSLELGADFRPTPKLVVNVTYEMATRLNFVTTVNGGKNGNGLFVNGAQGRLDLPQVLRLGAGWQLDPKNRLSGGFNAYLEGSANLSLLNNPTFGIIASQAYGNTTEESLALEHRLNPRWLLSFGLNLNQIGQKKGASLDISLPGGHANYLSEGTGFEYQASPRLKLNVGLAHTAFIHAYQNSDAGDARIASAFVAQGAAIAPAKVYDKEYIIFAAGLDYHF